MKKTRLALLLAAFATVALGFVGCQPEVEHEHSWDDGTVTLEPTCTEKGIKIFKCTDTECGEERTEDIAAKGHSYGDWTITDDMHWKECSECGNKIEEADHSFALVTTDTVKHWKECGCGKKIEETNHNFIYKGNCWQECECGGKKAVSLDVLGTYDSTKMTFGVYPQTIKAGSVTVDKSVRNTEISGAEYYLGSDGAWYAECIENAVSTGNQYKYSDGSTVAQKDANSFKYFKVEPIEWVYLAETKCLHAKKILTANVMWDEDDNNYKNSNIRSWLNGTFYNSAFTESQKEKIKETLVDNSAASTTDAGNKLPQATACEDTQDKIFLLSEKEATTTGNGYTAYDVYGTGNSRIRFPTDYALANYCNKSSDSSYGGWWWLRSPDNTSIFARYINSYGDAYYLGYFNYESGGVVPALSINEYE